MTITKKIALVTGGNIHLGEDNSREVGRRGNDDTHFMSFPIVPETPVLFCEPA
jgi:hypothetical protein